MYDYTSQTPFQVKFNDAEYRFAADHLQGGELAEFQSDWRKGSVTAVQFWLDTVAMWKGLPCRWHVAA